MVAFQTRMDIGGIKCNIAKDLIDWFFIHHLQKFKQLKEKL